MLARARRSRPRIEPPSREGPALRPLPAPTEPPPGLPPIAWQAPAVDLLVALLGGWKLTMWLALGGLSLGGAALALAPVTYRATAVAILLPREKPPGLDATINTGSLKTSEDRTQRGAGALMLPPNPDLYVALLRSRNVLERLGQGPGIELMSPRDRSDEIVSKIRRMIALETSDEGLITITVTCTDPEAAANIANECVLEMEKASKAIERQLVLRQAGYMRDVLQDSLAALAKHEAAYEAFCKKNNLSDPGIQIAQSLRMVNETQSRLDKTRADLDSRLLHYTEEDTEVQRLRQTCELYERRLVEIRRSFVGVVNDHDYGGLLAEYERLRANLRSSRDVVSTLTLQSEIFRIRAEQPAGSVAEVSQAVPALKPAGPSKKKFLGAGLALGLLGGCFLSVVWRQWLNALSDPYVRGRVETIVDMLPGLLRRLLERVGFYGS